MGDLSGRNEGYAPTLQRSGEGHAKSESPPPHSAGTVLGGRYRIDAPLGEGGMGRVYEGEHLLLGRKVAIKVLHRRLADQPAMLERFRTEARSASRISHPNVVPVYDYGETESRDAFLVMDLLRGEPLSQTLERGPLALDAAIHILHQVALALRAAHAAGVIHRDLKPANVFLLAAPPGEPPCAQVLDFGMAKLVDLGPDRGGLTAAGEILGTPEYMAPEQAVGGEVDRRTDVYAFGCLAFEVWCGHPPFSGANYVNVLAKQLDEKAPRIGELRDAPPAFEALIARLLAKRKEDRPQTIDAVLEELGRIAEEEGFQPAPAPSDTPSLPGVTPLPAGPSRQSARRRVLLRRRTRRLLGAIALLLLGALAGGASWRAFGPRRPPTGPATLVLTTTPPGATLFVDGQPLAEESPSMARLPPGAHHIEARLAHYVTAKVDRDFSPGATEVIKLPLARDTYKMSVSSEPPGAQLSLDGFVLGITPMEVDVDPLDPHTLRLERLGRSPWEVLLPEGDRRPTIHAVMKKRSGGDAE